MNLLNKKIIILFLLLRILLVGQNNVSLSKVTVSSLKCDYLKNPLGIDNLQPQLSWEIHSPVRGEKQTAYQIIVASSKEKLLQNIGDVWDSKKVNSSQSVQVQYAGKPLSSRKRYYWKVRIWDKNKIVSDYSKPASWEMALLDDKDWKAKWISAPRVFNWNKRGETIMHLSKTAPPLHDEPSPLFRKEFNVDRKLKSAKIYITGLGYYELYINGEKVGDHILDPAFTNYDKRVLYLTYDIKKFLKEGMNAIGVMLGNGWYNMITRAVWSFDRAPWKDDPVLLCQIELNFEDGSKKIIVSDSNWKCAPGPITFNSIRQGETYDANLEQEGWNKTGFNEKQWHNVRMVRGPNGKLKSQLLPPIKVIKEIKPKKINKINNQTFVIDFGENISGFVKIKVAGKKGQKIFIKYGERLDSAGYVDQKEISKYVREERFQTDVYIMKGNGIENWHPRFTYHGFQYAEIKGFPETPNSENIHACIVHTAFDTAGYFQSSNELLNKIQKITVRSYLNNFHGYPTDCPHREKLGWLNDAELISETGLFNFQSQTAYKKFIYDILDSQLPNGQIPPVVPTSGWGYQWNIGPAYDNAIITLPWNLYIYSADLNILKEVYPKLKKYFEYYQLYAKDNLVDLGLGDWSYAKTQTPKIITATAYYYFEAKLLGRIAKILGYIEDSNKFFKISDNIKTAFQNKILNNIDSTITQTLLGCILHMGLVDSIKTDSVANQLISFLSRDKMNLDFGVIGAKSVLEGLTITGKTKVAYNLVNNTNYPGWGYWVKKGATTLWESWDGKKLSLNHIMFGSVSAWIYKAIVGIRPDPEYPGFKHFYISPFYAQDLSWVKANYQTLYGKIGIDWKKERKKITLKVEIPGNTSATIVFPVQKIEEITENNRIFNSIDLYDYKCNDSSIYLTLGSGTYTFSFKTNEHYK